jgi:hypothetical protein
MALQPPGNQRSAERTIFLFSEQREQTCTRSMEKTSIILGIIKKYTTENADIKTGLPNEDEPGREYKKH